MLEWILSSALLILVVTGLRYLLRGRSDPRLVYALWGLVLVRLLLPVSLGQSGISVANLLSGPGEQPWRVEDAGPALLPEADGLPSRADVPSADQPSPARPADASLEEGRGSASGLRPEEVLFALWLAGGMLTALCLVGSGLHHAAALRRTRRPFPVEDCPLPVFLSPLVESPCLVGPLRPVIYITPEAAGDPRLLRHVLAHECTHYRHGDHIWAALRVVCLCLHWYDPLVWLAALLSRRDGELACDAGALRRLGAGERADYGRSILAMSCARGGLRSLLSVSTAMGGGDQSLRERITLIARGPKTAVCPLVAGALMVVLAVGCTFTGPQETSPASAAPDAFSVTVEVEEGLPEAVIRHAMDYVALRAIDLNESWRQLSPACCVTAAKITGLTPMTDSAAGAEDLALYLLEYRLLLEGEPEAVIAGGMTYEEEAGRAWLTEWDSTGQPCLLFHRTQGEGQESWEPVCAVSTDTVRLDYSSPDLLAQYGSAWAAAAAELYRTHRTDVAVYDCAGMSVAIPGAYADELLLYPGAAGDGEDGEDVLLRVYGRAATEAFAAAGLGEDESVGWLFSIVRWDQARYEASRGDPVDSAGVFARDGQWYYRCVQSSDSTFYPTGDMADQARWEVLRTDLVEEVKADFIARNGLEEIVPVRH